MHHVKLLPDSSYTYIYTITCIIGNVNKICSPRQPTGDGATVEISEPMLLDESADVFSITITSSGQLVWDPEAGPIELRASYIWVEGRLDIGSEDCPYEEETTITLTGIFLLIYVNTLTVPLNPWHRYAFVDQTA